MSAWMTSRHAASVVIAWLALFSLSCGGEPVQPPEPPPVPPVTPGQPPPPAATGPVSALIPPGGGTLSAVTGEGTTVSLSFPAGAVKTPTQVTIRPLAADLAARMRIALEPAAHVFDKPFTLSVVFAAGELPANTRLILRPDGDRIFLATSIDVSARRLSTTALSFFGFADSVSAQSGGSVTASAASQGNGNVVAAAPATCSQIVADGQSSFDSFLTQKKFEDAAATALTTAAALVDAECHDEAENWIDLVLPTTCSGLEDFIASLSGPISSYGKFETEATELLGWGGLVQILGECSADWEGALEHEADEFVTFAAARADSVTAPNYVGFLDLRDEARQLLIVRAKADLLALDAASAKIELRAFFPTLRKMRAIGYTLCRQQQWQYPLSRLTSVGFFAGRDIIGIPAPRPGDIPPPDQYADFTNADIHDDLQYCGTALTVIPAVASGGFLTTQAAGGLGIPGAKSAVLTIDAPTRGKIRLDGQLYGLTCWNDIAADQAITLEINGHVVQTLTRSGLDPYLDGGSIELDVADIAEQVGFTPKEGSSSSLIVRRKRTACDDGLWGPRDVELLDVTLQWKNPTLEVEMKLPAVLPDSGQVEAEVRVKVIDQLNQPGYYDDIDVVLEVAGGIALQPTGTTDGQGYFRTMIQLPSPVVAGAAVAAAQNTLTVTASATSFEGVTAQATETVNGVWYRNDFSSTAGTGWSSQQIATSPSGQRFLGAFGNASASLDLTNLPAHTELEIEFDLYILGSMDGNDDGFGLDLIQVELDGVILKRTTFSNEAADASATQSFPGDYPGGSYPPATGATGINVLGFQPFDPGDEYGDTTYRLTFTVPHNAGSLRLLVRGSGQEGYPNEGWGIDNVRIIAR